MICIIEMLGFKLHANYCTSSVKLEKKNVMEGRYFCRKGRGIFNPYFLRRESRIYFFFENDELEQKLTFIEWFWYVEISS